jgi:hypothetical protein
LKPPQKHQEKESYYPTIIPKESIEKLNISLLTSATFNPCIFITQIDLEKLLSVLESPRSGVNVSNNRKIDLLLVG